MVLRQCLSSQAFLDPHQFPAVKSLLETNFEIIRDDYNYVRRQHQHCIVGPGISFGRPVPDGDCEQVPMTVGMHAWCGA
jgi:hypothetical protein